MALLDERRGVQSTQGYVKGHHDDMCVVQLGRRQVELRVASSRLETILLLRLLGLSYPDDS